MIGLCSVRTQKKMVGRASEVGAGLAETLEGAIQSTNVSHLSPHSVPRISGIPRSSAVGSFIQCTSAQVCASLLVLAFRISRVFGTSEDAQPLDSVSKCGHSVAYELKTRIPNLVFLFGSKLANDIRGTDQVL
jgi:hypothetical protein